MIINKFNYLPLSRKNISGKRHYITPDGSAVSSVTTILDKTKSRESKEALYNWRRRVGPAEATLITKAAANRGTNMHSFIEKYVSNDDMGKPTADLANQLSHTMATHVLNNGLCHISEYYGSEINLYYPSLYAGTTDLCALYKDELTIIDFKQTNKPKKIEWIDDYFCQLAAYIAAHNELYKTDIKHGIIMMCSRDLQYQQFEITPKNINEWTDKWFERVAQYYGV